MFMYIPLESFCLCVHMLTYVQKQISILDAKTKGSLINIVLKSHVYYVYTGNCFAVSQN